MQEQKDAPEEFEVVFAVIWIGAFLILIGLMGLDKTARYACFVNREVRTVEKKQVGLVLNDEKINRKLLAGEEHAFYVKPGKNSGLLFSPDINLKWRSNGPFCLRWDGGEDCYTPEEYEGDQYQHWKPAGNYKVSSYPGWGKKVKVAVRCEKSTGD